MTRRQAVVGGLVAAVVGLNLVALALDRLTGAPGGPPSSSYATAPEGLAAYAELLRRFGHPVVRVREPVREADLGASATVVLLDPGRVPAEDARALRDFVERGGRLVAGGAEPGAWLDRLLDDPPAWSREGARRVTPLAPAPEVDGVGTAQTAGDGSWTDGGKALPVLGGAGGSVVAVATPGRGRVVLLADASLLQNRLLAAADNAVLGLALAGERSRPVAFVESVHGYGEATGLRAIPISWRFALGGLALAALTLMLARGRRLGPPEREARDLPPPRREYVDSLAAVLARTKRPDEALEPVRAAARTRLARRAGLTADADADTLARAAARFGLPDDEIRAVLGGGGSGPNILAAGSALARLEQGAARDGSAER